MAKKLSHYDAAGRARMVDVSGKPATRREAEASAFVQVKPAVLKALPKNPKGDPFEVARIAGIMAAKRTAELHTDVPHAPSRARCCRHKAMREWRRHYH